MNTTEKELKAINEQIVATILFLGTIIVSLSLSIDKRQKILNKKAIYSNEKAQNIAIINRIIALYITYNSKTEDISIENPEI